MLHYDTQNQKKLIAVSDESIRTHQLLNFDEISFQARFLCFATLLSETNKEVLM